MKISNQIKVYLTVCGIMTASATYALLQSQSLKEELDTAAQQCELKAEEILKQDNQPDQIVKLSTVIKTSEAPETPPKIDTKSVAVQEKQARAERLKNQPKLQKFTDTLDDIINNKYRFLLSKLDLSAEDLNQLMELLKQREKVALQLKDAKEFGDVLGLTATNVADLQYQLDVLDDEIAQILSANGMEERYTLLKDSDNEQKEFSHYTLGITSLFPLEPQQQEQVLISKLRHKQQFEKALEDAGFNMDYPLADEEKAALLTELENNAEKYMQGFLKDVKPHIDHSNFPMDQYTLLENYTKTEFKEMLEKLKEQLNSRESH